MMWMTLIKRFQFSSVRWKKGSGEAINAREYRDNLLYPLFQHCEEKVKMISDLFNSVTTFQDSFSVRLVDNKISELSLTDKEKEDWPGTAFFISGKFSFYLSGYQAKRGSNFELEIHIEEESNRSLWKFQSWELDYNEEYTGRSLHVLKKMFNDMIRQMMKKLSEDRENR